MGQENTPNQTLTETVPGYITKQELAQRLRKTTRTVDVWIKDGRLPFVKICRSILFHWPTVHEHLTKTYGNQN